MMTDLLLIIDTDNIHTILRQLYDDMMPLCSQMTGVARAVAGFGALFYIAYRVWQSLARAEPIDVFPMLRPFAIGICILLFPSLVLGTMNSVMSPIVQGVSTMLEGQKLDLDQLRQQKDELETEMMKRNPETAYLVDDAAFDKELDNLGISPSDLATMAGMYAERGLYKLQKMIRDGFRYILELVFEAVSLMIDVLRTFFLIVLSILGPLAFGIAVYDGFQSTLTGWMCRHTGENPAVEHRARHRADADGPGLLARLVGRRVPYRDDHRHHRLLHRAHGGRMGDTGGRHRQLQPQREQDHDQERRGREERRPLAGQVITIKTERKQN